MKIRLLTIALAFSLSASAAAEDVIVTRHFSGHWDQPEQESQGLILQVVNQSGGLKNAVAYWFTYADDRESSWLLGVGPVEGNRVELDLFRASDVGFLEDDHPGNANVVQVGSMEIEFSSCDDGTVSFSSTDSDIGSGDFPISRITSIFNTECSGGISDDTPSDALMTDQRINLTPARQGITASGHADFKELPDRTEFSVEGEDLADGSYRIVVGGVDRGELVINAGRGETEFRSPVEAGKILLTFDPQNQTIEIHDRQGAVLASGDAGFSSDDDSSDDDSSDDDSSDDDSSDDDSSDDDSSDDDSSDDDSSDDDSSDDDSSDDDSSDDDSSDDDSSDDDSSDDDSSDDDSSDDDSSDDDSSDDDSSGDDDNRSEIEVDLTNAGVFPEASGEAKFEARDDRTEFSVEIEDVPAGTYDLKVGGTSVGDIHAVMDADGTIRGETEFRDPVEPGKILLDFDPRGQSIEVLDGATLILDVAFPMN